MARGKGGQLYDDDDLDYDDDYGDYEDEDRAWDDEAQADPDLVSPSSLANYSPMLNSNVSLRRYLPVWFRCRLLTRQARQAPVLQVGPRQ